MDDTRRDTPRDPWAALATRTPARIRLGRAGASLPTRELLAFGLAHAQARDAVHGEIDSERLMAELTGLGFEPIAVDSRAVDRTLYLARPDLGRRLSETSATLLESRPHEPADLAIVVADGLSAAAVNRHAVALVSALLPHINRLGLSLAPVTVAKGARVALGDEIASRLGGRLVLVLIGERPGLSSPDSLGAYLTYEPKPGRTDAERNCVSNIRPEGLAPERAAAKLEWLIGAALSRRLTGVGLKDDREGELATEPKPALPDATG